MLEDRVLGEFGDVIPSTRDAVLEEWEADPTRIIQQSDEAQLPLDSFLTARAGPTEESPGSTTEWLLYNSGVRMVDTWSVPSTIMSVLPNIEERATEPIAHLMNAYWDERYNHTLMTGERAAASLLPLESQTIWRPLVDESPFRQPSIAPAFDFRNLLAFARRIPEDQFRLNRLTNDKSEQVMQVLAEGTEPKLFEMKRGSDIWKMTEYRAGIEATDSFLNDPQVRAADITNAVEEIAIGHRIMLLRDAVKLITGTPLVTGRAYTSGGQIAGVKHEMGRVSYPHWEDFKTKFGTAYGFDSVIGNEKSIIAFKLMSITDGQNLSLGSWSMMPNTNITDWNGDMTNFGYGWVDDPENVTGLGTDFKIWAFQRATTIGYIQRSGMDQDEIERVPGPRKVRRWLGTESLFCRIDPGGVGTFDFNGATFSG